MASWFWWSCWLWWYEASTCWLLSGRQTAGRWAGGGNRMMLFHTTLRMHIQKVCRFHILKKGNCTNFHLVCQNGQCTL